MLTIDLSVLPDENVLIHSLTNRTAELYDSYGDCSDRCNHPSGSCNTNFCRSAACQNCSVNNMQDERDSCQGCCLECSEEVHYHTTYRRAPHRDDYTCQKLIYYYTCRYSWKYCSEIIYALESADLNKYEAYKVLSLGCGQCPDLMALEHQNRTDLKSIFYSGYDINGYWSNVHAEIHNYCQQTGNMHCHHEIGDVIDLLQRNPGGFANVIVMSYLLSSLSDFERSKKASVLFDLIICKVIDFKGNEPVLILINDIDHNTKARDYFDVFIYKLKQAGYHGKFQKKHFGDRNGRDYGDASTQHSSCANRFTIPNSINEKYNCAIRCTSAQCIIEVS